MKTFKKKGCELLGVHWQINIFQKISYLGSMIDNERNSLNIYIYIYDQWMIFLIAQSLESIAFQHLSIVLKWWMNIWQLERGIMA